MESRQGSIELKAERHKQFHIYVETQTSRWLALRKSQNDSHTRGADFVPQQALMHSRVDLVQVCCLIVKYDAERMWKARSSDVTRNGVPKIKQKFIRVILQLIWTGARTSHSPDDERADIAWLTCIARTGHCRVNQYICTLTMYHSARTATPKK